MRLSESIIQNSTEFYQSNIPKKQNELHKEKKNTILQTNKTETIFIKLFESMNAEDKYNAFLKEALNKINRTDLAHYLTIVVTTISQVKHFVLKYGPLTSSNKFPFR